MLKPRVCMYVEPCALLKSLNVLTRPLWLPGLTDVLLESSALLIQHASVCCGSDCSVDLWLKPPAPPLTTALLLSAVELLGFRLSRQLLDVSWGGPEWTMHYDSMWQTYRLLKLKYTVWTIHCSHNVRFSVSGYFKSAEKLHLNQYEN